jgi:hypothetical protein
VNLQVTFFLTDEEVAANDAIERRRHRFITPDGAIDIPALLAEYARRVADYPVRAEAEVALDLNCAVVAEQGEWSRRRV